MRLVQALGPGPGFATACHASHVAAPAVCTRFEGSATTFSAETGARRRRTVRLTSNTKNGNENGCTVLSAKYLILWLSLGLVLLLLLLLLLCQQLHPHLLLLRSPLLL